EALEDYGGTLILVSHDRYFVERLATKVIEVGHGGAEVYPGTYAEFLWSKKNREAGTADRQSAPASPASAKQHTRPTGPSGKPGPSQGPTPPAAPRGGGAKPADASADRDARKRVDAERKKQQRATEALQRRIAELEARIAATETQVKELESAMGEAGFYEDPLASKPVIERHQALMWEVGNLMSQWEALQQHADEAATER
ncbi:MAG TPA: hypothetical protein VIY56_18645, partial [Vicinamibacterales bacterium]